MFSLKRTSFVFSSIILNHSLILYSYSIRKFLTLEISTSLLKESWEEKENEIISRKKLMIRNYIYEDSSKFQEFYEKPFAKRLL